MNPDEPNWVCRDTLMPAAEDILAVPNCARKMGHIPAIHIPVNLTTSFPTSNRSPTVKLERPKVVLKSDSRIDESVLVIGDLSKKSAEFSE